MILKLLLEYLEDPTLSYSYGIWIIVLLIGLQLIRNITFNLYMALGIQTGICNLKRIPNRKQLILPGLRLLGALQYLGYTKLLKLASPNDSALGLFITFVSADHERIHEAVNNVGFLIGGPVCSILSFAYSIWLVGPSAIVGVFIVLLFFPMMVREGLKIRKKIMMEFSILNNLNHLNLYIQCFNITGDDCKRAKLLQRKVCQVYR